jgi:GH15 family glucan-1,4-alpha-glucosidase
MTDSPDRAAPTTSAAIADHGVIGDLRTAALVTTDGSIDWFCAPRFDSPSVFGALLDPDRGGHCSIRPRGTSYSTQQMYLPETAILITRFLSEDGVGEVVDFMPPAPGNGPAQHRLVRMLTCARGALTFDVTVAPRFDYGRREHEVRLTDAGAVFEAGDDALTLHAVRERDDERLAQVSSDDGDLHVELPLSAGQTRGVVLEWGSRTPRELSPMEIGLDFAQTTAFWRSWLSGSTYRGRWREMVERSAITLKLMTYAPTGGLVAAPTTALPEQVGGERNWDYRYTWVRDASFSVRALLGLGFVEEATAFAIWLRDRVAERADGQDRPPLDIMYRVDGSSDLVEESLDHWAGYRGSRPVRIGNGAAEQLQLDIYGEALDSIYAGDEAGLEPGYAGWTGIVSILDWVAENWDQPEEGIWETRGGRQDFTYGRAMCWIALDRGIRLAVKHGRPAPLDRWTTARDAIYAQIFDRGWNAERGAFVQHYATDVLDSSLLRAASLGLFAPHDPMWLSTLDAMRSELVSDSLVYRYDPGASPDGLRGSEGTFSLCTFSWVDALARSGRLEEARLTFEKMLTYANHVGLFSEEIALTGEQIGNFPQAFTHLALIDAALTLDAALDDAAGRSAAESVAGQASIDLRAPTNGHRAADVPLARSGGVTGASSG